jgi:hypothetical protein
VDRTLMDDSSYQPHVIQDPYNSVFKHQNWRKEAQNWLIRPGFEHQLTE